MKAFKQNLKRTIYLNTNNGAKTTNGIVSSITLNTAGTYSVVPSVVLTGGGGNGASAVPVMTAVGLKTTIPLISAGTYTSAPTGTISGGGGTGATPTITLIATTVASVSIVNKGTAYTSAPLLTFSGGGGTSQATATATISGGSIATIVINTAGVGYTSVPTLTVSGGGGSGFTWTVNLTPTGISIATTAGSGYTSNPKLTLTNDGCIIPAIVGIVPLADSAMSSITVSSSGVNYSSVPTVSFVGGTATTNSVATAVLNNANPRVYSISWNIPEIVINEVGILQIATIASTGVSDATKIYTFRLENLSINSNTNIATDGGSPIICSLLMNNYNSMFRDDFGTYLMPQSITNLNLSLSDDYTNRLAGISSAVGFVMCVVISELQAELAEINNPYLDAIQQAKSVPKYKIVP